MGAYAAFARTRAAPVVQDPRVGRVERRQVGEGEPAHLDDLRARRRRVALRRRQCEVGHAHPRPPVAIEGVELLQADARAPPSAPRAPARRPPRASPPGPPPRPGAPRRCRAAARAGPRAPAGGRSAPRAGRPPASCPIDHMGRRRHGRSTQPADPRRWRRPSPGASSARRTAGSATVASSGSSSARARRRASRSGAGAPPPRAGGPAGRPRARDRRPGRGPDRSAGGTGGRGQAPRAGRRWPRRRRGRRPAAAASGRGPPPASARAGGVAREDRPGRLVVHGHVVARVAGRLEHDAGRRPGPTEQAVAVLGGDDPVGGRAVQAAVERPAPPVDGRRCRPRAGPGSARCRAPRRWTTTVARGNAAAAIPVAPQWSRWTCVRTIHARSPGPMPASDRARAQHRGGGPRAGVDQGRARRRPPGRTR